MATTGESQVYLMENSSTEIYTHVEKELATGTVDGSTSNFTLGNNPASITGLDSNPLSQFTDSNGDYFRRDVLVYYRKDGSDSVVDTNSNSISISGSTVTFTTAPTTTEADNVVVSYSHTKADRSDEITSLDFGGGGRPQEFIPVQGGTKIRVQRPQEQRTITLNALSVDKGFVDFINGTLVSWNQGTGSDLIEGSVGAQDITPRTIVVKVDDPITDNQRIEMMFNVSQVSADGSAPSDEWWTETASFEAAPQDFCRLNVLNNQGSA